MVHLALTSLHLRDADHGACVVQVAKGAQADTTRILQVPLPLPDILT